MRWPIAPTYEFVSVWISLSTRVLISGKLSDELEKSSRVGQRRTVPETDQRRLQGGDTPGRAAVLRRVGREQQRRFAQPGEREIGQDVAEHEHAIGSSPE